MKKILFCLLFLGAFAISNAQKNGKNITIKTTNMVGETIKMSLYTGNYKNPVTIDSIKISQPNEVVKFVEPKKIISAIYQLSIAGDAKKIDIVVDNGSVLNFDLKYKDITQITTTNPLNKEFLDYQHSQIKSVRNQLEKSFVKKYPTSVLALFSQMEIRKDESATIMQQKSADSRAIYLKGFDLNDKRIKLLPNVYSFLLSYVTLNPINNTEYKENVNVLLNKQNCNSPNFQFYLAWIFKNFDFYAQNQLFDSYQYTFNTYLNDKVCIDKFPKFYKKISESLSKYQKIPVGSTLPEFEMLDFDENRLQSKTTFVKSPYTFVMFYDPACLHCQELTPKVTAFFDELEKKGNSKFQKIAIINTPQKSEWKNFVESKNLKNWINTKIPDEDKDFATRLDISGNPVFYVVDKNGKVILKNYNPEFIQNLQNSNP